MSIKNIGHRPAFSVVQKTDATLIKTGISTEILFAMKFAIIIGASLPMTL